MECVESSENFEDMMSREETTNPVIKISPCSLLTKASETFEGSGDSSLELQEENSSAEKNIGVRKYRPRRFPSGSDNSSECDYKSHSFINMEAVSFLRTPEGAHGHVDRFVTEENLLDSLFHSCDVRKSGKVRPSDLIDCVHSIIIPRHQNNETKFAEDLACLLDPRGKDEEVDMKTFTCGVSQWITKCQLENMDNSVFLDKGVLNSSRLAAEDDVVPQWCSSQRKRHKSLGLDVSMFSFGSLEGNGGDMSLLDAESTDLQSKVEDLNFQIRKLTEQNSKLKSQLEVTEESNSQLVLDLETLKQQIKGSQVISQRSQCVRQENQELKTTLTNTEDAKKEIQRKYEHLENEKVVLETRVTNLEDELLQTQHELECLQQEKTYADDALRDFKEIFKAVQEQLAAQEMESSERVQKCEELKKHLDEEQKEKEKLKTEKTQLENQIRETRQELMVFQSQEQVMDVEFSSGGNLLAPINTSTPQKAIIPGHRSLHSELKCLVSQESNLPSPLCGTPDHELEDEEPMLFAAGDEKINLVTSELKIKKDAIKKQIHQILAQKAISSQQVIANKANQVVSEDLLYAEIDSFTENVTSFANEKSESEQRIMKLRHIIKKLRDENSKMVKKHAEALIILQKQPESQPAIESMRDENEKLKSALSEANLQIQNLDEKIDKCKAEFANMQDEAQTVAHALQEQSEHCLQLETQLEQHKNTLNKLKDDLKTKEEIIVKLELQLHEAEDELEESRKQLYTLENSLTVSMSEHHTDLKGIMSLVSCSDCSSNESQYLCSAPIRSEERRPRNKHGGGLVRENEDYVEQLHGQTVKDRIGRQLSDLQTQLAKQKSKIASLETLKSNQCQTFKNVADLVTNTKNSLLNQTYTEHNSTSLFSALSLELDKRLITAFTQHPASSSQTLARNTSHDLLSKYLRTFSVSTQTELPRTPNHHCDQDHWNNRTHRKIIPGADHSIHISCDCNQHAGFERLDTTDSKLHTLQDLLDEDSDSSCDSVFYSAVHTPTRLHSVDLINQSPRFSYQEEAMPIMQPPNIAEGLDENCNNGIRSSPIPPNITFWHSKSSLERQEEAQKMADMLANSYARPAQQISSHSPSSQTDEDGLLHPVALPTRKLSPRLKRRSQPDRSRRSLPVNVSDLLNGNVDDVELSEADKELNSKLIEESKKASERFKNRKGRRAGAGGLTGNSNRSQSPSPRNINSEDDSESDIEANELGKPSSINIQVPTCAFVSQSSPTTKLGQNPQLLSDDIINQKMDEDDQMQSSDDQMDRQEADLDIDIKTKVDIDTKGHLDVDIKADILKVIGPVQPDQAKASAQLSKLRMEHKFKRNPPVFKMPELAEASETESTREAESPCESDASMLATHEVPQLISENNEIHEDIPRIPPEKLPEETKPMDIPETQESQIDTECGVEKTDIKTDMKDKEEIVTNDGDNDLVKEDTVDMEMKSAKRLSTLLPESVLRSLGLSKSQKDEPNVLTEKEVEDKFLNLALALKTDKFTLEKRVYLHGRQRNIAEANIDEELEELQRILRTLDPLCKDLEAKDCINKIRSHLEYLHASSTRLCSKAELLGATQQENRLSAAAEVMIKHVENLKKMYEKEHAELEEARKLLEENKLLFRGNSLTGLATDAEDRQGWFDKMFYRIAF
ncbi:lymphoid-restricted membrane protein-like isoform X2 [Anneissia japonica]|uniref:lymphoid-restricted membrane protein-like isoform X2 n=1 Tax=Anneissia japonica TaxID=1529436 RepID=UPI001425B256|nr:lymphoid-restricted membrane protein-like isoform X2 [Anneissia japonica]